MLENKGRVWDALWDTLSTTEYEKISYLRRSQGGSFKSKHAEEEKIRLVEEKKRHEDNLRKKKKRDQKRKEREEQLAESLKKSRIDPWWFQTS